MTRFNGVVFGPGYRDSGTPLGFAADADGIILEGGNDSVLEWSHLTIGKAGWDGGRLNLEWQRDGAHYALIVADKEMAQALEALAGRQATLAAGPGAATRAWSWGLISATVGLPLLLLALLLATHERIAGWVVDLVSIEQERSLGAQPSIVINLKCLIEGCFPSIARFDYSQPLMDFRIFIITIKNFAE